MVTADYYTTLFDRDSYPRRWSFSWTRPWYDYSSIDENTRFNVSVIKRLRQKFEVSLQYHYEDMDDTESIAGTLKFLL